MFVLKLLTERELTTQANGTLFHKLTSLEIRAVAKKPRDAAAVIFRFKVHRRHSLQV